MFQLTKEEFDFLKSQFAMSNITDSQGNKNLKSQIAISKWGGTRKLPYAFTRNGVANEPVPVILYNTGRSHKVQMGTTIIPTHTNPFSRGS